MLVARLSFYEVSAYRFFKGLSQDFKIFTEIQSRVMLSSHHMLHFSQKYTMLVKIFLAIDGEKSNSVDCMIIY